MKTTKVFADRVKLRWEPPLADGGSEITNYIIEKRETSRANWALVTSNIHGHITDCSVEKLIEGHEYQFRVSAENQYGVGDPIMTDPVMVKNPYGEFSILLLKLFQQQLSIGIPFVLKYLQDMLLIYHPTLCCWLLKLIQPGQVPIINQPEALLRYQVLIFKRDKMKPDGRLSS